MKTITYSVSKQNINMLQTTFLTAFNKLVEGYKAAPKTFVFKSLDEATQSYLELAKTRAIAKLLEEDGLMRIEKHEDKYYTFADHAGDIFKPDANPDIDKAELKRQERRERARFNRQGVFYHVLVVEGNEVDSIAGFVGNDFEGSGYDDDFYSEAVSLVAQSHPQYMKDIHKQLKASVHAGAVRFD